MRIGFFTDFYLPLTDGVGISIETTRKALTELGHEVYVIAPAPSLRYKETDDHVIRFPGITGLLYDVQITSLFFPPYQQRQIKKLDLDIIHIHTPGQIGLLGLQCAVKYDIPLVSTYHTDYYEYAKLYPTVMPVLLALSFALPFMAGGRITDILPKLSLRAPRRSSGKLSQKLVVNLMTQIHDRCDAVIVPSEKFETQLLQWKTKAPISVIGTGVDKLTTKSKLDPRSKYNISPSDTLLLSVGRIAKEKNLNLLISMMALLTNEHPNIKLIFCGDSAYRLELEEITRKKGLGDNIFFAGWIKHEELAAYYDAADIFVFPSKTDTQGLVVNEAAHAGLPIVMCDPKITQVVKDTVTGLVAPSTPQGFKTAILKLAKDATMRSKFGAAGKKLALQYTPSHQANKLDELYTSLSAKETTK